MQGGVETIEPYVSSFISFASEHPELFFYVTRIGCGLAGFREKEIAPLFAGAIGLENVLSPGGVCEGLEVTQVQVGHGPGTHRIKIL